jgi:peptidoglycan/xylan/chitin deacetylase (PgdA/CDA1 family)
MRLTTHTSSRVKRLIGAAGAVVLATLALSGQADAAVHPARVVAPVRITGAVATLTFDDGLINQWTYARPVLRAAHVNGTFYIISDALGWGTKTNMSPAMVKQLYREGDDIGNHTRDHSDLATLSSTDVWNEFSQSQAAIRAQTGITPHTCAYPYGSSDGTVQTIAHHYFQVCRGTSSGTNTIGHLASPYDLTVLYMQTDTTASDVRAAANAAKASHKWLILVYHGVGTVGSADDVTGSAFRGHVAALKASGIRIATMSQVLGIRH